MDEHPNATMYRALVEAFDQGDMDVVSSMLSDDIAWHEAGSDAVVNGKEALAARFAGIGGIDGTVDVHDILANDQHVVAMITATMRKPDGSSVSYPAVEIAHVSNGVVTERWAFMDAVPADVETFFAGLG